MNKATLRESLKAAAKSWGAQDRRAARIQILKHLKGLFLREKFSVLGFYWPIHHEIDVRRLAPWCRAQGMVLALPWAKQKGEALTYRRWAADSPMGLDAWGVVSPLAEEPVVPNAILIPLLGFDSMGFRLGYGGGVFDRTLAAASPPLAVGVGFEIGRVNTIHPEPHDRPMQWVVTELGIQNSSRATLKSAH